MTREEELLDLIDKANELIAVQDRIINHQECKITVLKERVKNLDLLNKKLQEANGHQDDIIKLLQLRVKELEG